jgi:hypothetical protein
MLAQSKRSLP